MYLSATVVYRSVILVLFLFGGILLYVTIMERYSEKPVSPTADFEGCIKKVEQDVNLSSLDLQKFDTIWNICDLQLYQQLSYDDFAIRREKFRQQELDERVNLWLVVAITFSGLVLAALQLQMSYRLALREIEVLRNDSTLIVEQGRISFRSSITGLSILAISFVFFVVYVRWIYMDQEIGATPSTAKLQIPPQGHEIQEAGAIGKTVQKPADTPRSTLPVTAAPPNN